MKYSILLTFNIFCLMDVYCLTKVNYDINVLYDSDSDLKISLLLEDCSENLPVESSYGRTIINSAIWTVERLNLLQITSPLTLGLSVYQTCEDSDKYHSLFHIFQQQNQWYPLGIINVRPFSRNLIEFCQVLDIRTKYVRKNWKPLISASIELLTVLNWKENVTLLTEYKEIVPEFYKLARREWICIKEVIDSEIFPTISASSPVIIFADSNVIKSIIYRFENYDDFKAIVVPLDGEFVNDLPEGSFAIQPIYGEVLQEFVKGPKLIPSTLLLDVAHPIISYAEEAAQTLKSNCRGTSGKLNCVRKEHKYHSDHQTYSYTDLINILKIEPLTTKFNYNVYRVDNYSIIDSKKRSFHTLSKLFSYNVFHENLENDEIDIVNGSNTSEDCSKHLSRCISSCLNFQSERKHSIIFPKNVYARIDSWIFAFISISVLGVLFSLAIIVFIFVRVFQRYIFEGNPTLTVLLLVVVMIMYLSIIPFTIDGYDDAKLVIITARSLCVSLPYAAAFSLLLSRALLLATISKDVGFMSHVPGTIQSFLSLFIFGVQCALSIQVVRQCENSFHDFFLVYLLSYNVVLLLMLLCVTPLISRSQRNYKEGRYFAIGSILLTLSWCAWVPAYVLLEEEWKDPVLCMGLVSTASILLGSLFIPRTYMMAVAAARDRFTSALPSLATVTSAMDIYRASTQPLYDCVNVTTVNAVNGRNSSYDNNSYQQTEQNQCQQQELYLPPTALENEYEIRSQSTGSDPDKVTRF